MAEKCITGEGTWEGKRLRDQEGWFDPRGGGRGGRGGWRGHGGPGHHGGRGGGGGSAGGGAGRVACKLGWRCPLLATLAKCLVSYLCI